VLGGFGERERHDLRRLLLARSEHALGAGERRQSGAGPQRGARCQDRRAAPADRARDDEYVAERALVALPGASGTRTAASASPNGEARSAVVERRFGMPMSTTRSSPVCSEPGGRKWPRFGSANVTVSSRADRGA
jgi:hypothetical protein